MKYKERMDNAQLQAQERSVQFIKRFLRRRGIDAGKFSCTSLLVNRKVRCILKDFKHVGSGGVGVVRSCSNCRGNESTYDLSKPFPGTCRNNALWGDANKLLIIPQVPRGVTPEIVTISTEALALPDLIPLVKRIYVLD